MAAHIHKDLKGKIRVPTKGFMLWQQFAKLLPLLKPGAKVTFDGAESVRTDGDDIFVKKSDL